jgi:pyruvate formate lyase activating enzyme
MCGECTESCPSGALAIVGEYMTVAKVLHEVRKDSAFFWRSGGGVTISGGEPAMQDEFVHNLLKEANDISIHTAIETCGYVRWEKLEKLVPYTDTFLYDIKHMDSKIHKDLTGVHNELILKNARRIAQCSDVEIVFRTPIIPGKNDDIRNLVAIAEYAAHLDVRRWDLLPYHRYGESKYQQIGKDYPLERIELPDRERMMKILALAKDIFPRVMIENE